MQQRLLTSIKKGHLGPRRHTTLPPLNTNKIVSITDISWDTKIHPQLCIRRSDKGTERGKDALDWVEGRGQVREECNTVLHTHTQHTHMAPQLIFTCVPGSAAHWLARSC